MPSDAPTPASGESYYAPCGLKALFFFNQISWGQSDPFLQGQKETPGTYIKINKSIGHPFQGPWLLPLPSASSIWKHWATFLRLPSQDPRLPGAWEPPSATVHLATASVDRLAGARRRLFRGRRESMGKCSWKEGIHGGVKKISLGTQTGGHRFTWGFMSTSHFEGIPS